MKKQMRKKSKAKDTNATHKHNPYMMDEDSFEILKNKGEGIYYEERSYAKV